MRRSLPILILILICPGCDGFLDVDVSKALTTQEQIFSDDFTATAAVTAMYNLMGSGYLSGGDFIGISSITGLSSRELSSYQPTFGQAFEQHKLIPTNSTISGLWSTAYNVIYQANAIIEGVEKSKGLSAATASQLKGEARFMRAYTYFYLVNLFGDVPLVIETDYKKTRLLSRSSVAEVYKFVEDELIKSQSLLTNQYPTANRVRPNRTTATALLARVYLYERKYALAEAQVTDILNNSNYSLSTDLSKTFLIGSTETIWQLMPINPSLNTNEAQTFIITGTPQYYVLDTESIQHFETGDARKIIWIGKYTNFAGTFYFPFKYKALSKDPKVEYSECSVVFRLAEMYLIRAEARANVGKLVGANSASSDVNTIRSRAGLPGISVNDKESILLAIENERWSELFTEYGHRWLDLKRTNRAITVLGNGITQNDLLYPVPLSEFQKNPNLGEQNPGY
jgi:hypothetical protein